MLMLVLLVWPGDYPRGQSLYSVPRAKASGCHHFCVSFSFFFFGCAIKACGILVPWSGIEPMTPVVEAGSLNHWTTREVPCPHFWYLHLFVLFLTFSPKAHFHDHLLQILTYFYPFIKGWGMSGGYTCVCSKHPIFLWSGRRVTLLILNTVYQF